MSSTSNWMSANLFAKTESGAASARCDGSVWTVECVWMSYYACIELFVIFFFFWFATLYGFYYFWWKKHIKKQYKSTHACFSLCHRKLYTRKKTALNEFDLRGENKKRLRWCYRTDLYLTKTQFGSFFHQSRLIFLLTTTEKLWRGRTWTLLHVEKKTENICFGEI